MRSLHIYLGAVLLALAATAATADSLSKEPLPHEVVINGIELVLVPEGWFWYSVQNGERQQAAQAQRPMWRDIKVWQDAFYIAKYEGRARDFKRFMDRQDVVNRKQYWRGETQGCGVRRNDRGEYYLVDPTRDLPATHLSWQLASEFAQSLGMRLPTETEWVKAARGTDKRLWPWGNDYPDDTYAGYAGTGACDPVPVDGLSNGQSPYGVYNMAGNMYEYVADWYNEDRDLTLQDGARNPPLASTGTPVDGLPQARKILKGGRWASNASATSVYGRVLLPPDDSFVCYGVRFAMDVATVRTHLAKNTATVVKP